MIRRNAVPAPARPNGGLVVWDLHGVLLSGRPADQEEFAHKLRLDTAAWRRVMREYVDEEHTWDRVETGHLTLKAFAAELRRRVRAAGGDCSVEAATGIWGFPSPFATSRLNVPLVDYVEANHDRLRHAIGTNNIPEWADQWASLIDVSKFDWVFDSCVVGHRKPDADYWAFVEAQTGLAGAAVVLVDDRVTNVEAAISHGWSGIHFTDAETCMADLARWRRRIGLDRSDDGGRREKE